MGITLFAALAGAGYIFVTRIPDLGELGELPDSLDARDLEAFRAEKLEARRQILAARSQARQQVLSAVIDQRLTLLQAAARFRELDGGPEAETYRRCLRYYFTGQSDEERYCRMVIALVRDMVQEQGDSAMIVRQLEDELARYLRRVAGR
jgi:hypothetical protein